jgi:hypothetical protein
MLNSKQYALCLLLAAGGHSAAFACGDGKNVGIYAPGSTSGTWTLIDSGYYPAADGAAFDPEADVEVYAAGSGPGEGGGGGVVVQSVGESPWQLSYSGELVDDGGAYTQSIPCLPQVTTTGTTYGGGASSGFLHVIRPPGGGGLRFAALKKANVPANEALCASTDQAAKDAAACSAIRRVRPIVSAGTTFIVVFADASQLYTVTSPVSTYCAVPSGPCVSN